MMRLLTFVHYYLPGYKSGGPVRTIANMVDQLGDEIDFKIITLDRDFFDQSSYEDIKVNTWNRVGKAFVYYISPESIRFRELVQIIKATKHDILYLNSFFDPQFTGLPLLARRLGLIQRKSTVLAPRGEFSLGSYNLKAWKKKPYVAIAKKFGLFNAITWQASSQYEKSDIQRVMGNTASNIVVAPNLPPKSTTRTFCEPQASREVDCLLRIAFLSRISPKKNLDFALRVLAQVRVPVQMNLYGIVDDESYWAHCNKLIGQLPENVQIEHWGVVPHEQVQDVLSDHDLFFLPTRGENYGHAIYEALAAGTPVLISDQTPWRDLQDHGVGRDLPLSDIQGFINYIEGFASMDEHERVTMQQAAKEYAASVAGASEAVESNKELFEKAFRSNKTC